MGSSPQWRGQADTSSGRRRVWAVLAFSALLHVPLTPLAALFGLLALIGTTPVEVPPAPPIEAIPVDIIESAGPVAKPATDAPKPASASEPEAETKEPDEPEAEETKEEPLDDDSQPEKPELPPSETPPSTGVRDPMAMAGNLSKVADANANVRLFIFADRIRNHPLGTRIGELLGAADQWQDFFATGGIDPINDIDRILITGPQLRESQDVIAVLRHNAGREKIKSAVDALVKRDPNGKWQDGPVPSASARADRAERVFVLASPRILVVTPPSAAANVIQQAPSLRFPEPKGSEALSTYVVTPWRAFIGVPFEVPKSIRWVRMRIVPTSDGGATAELVAKDESEELAKQNAAQLTRDINKLTQINTGVVGAMFGLGTYRVIEPVNFTAKGDEIHGTVIAKPRQLGALLEAISRIAKDIAKKNAEKAKKANAANAPDAGSAVSPDAGRRASPDAGRPASDAAIAEEPAPNAEEPATNAGE